MATQDLPEDTLGAAHSMDTDWFAVDEDGHVGLFESGEAGAVPEAFLSTVGHQYSEYDLHDLLLQSGFAGCYDVSDLCDEADGRIFSASWDKGTRDAQPLPADAAPTDADYLLWLRDERFLERLPHLTRLPTADGKVLAFGEARGSQIRALRRAGAICRAWQHARVEVERWGVYRYAHEDRYENWVSGPYGREQIPRAPLHASALDEAARRVVERVRFEGLCFARARRIQPVEHHACSSWQQSFVCTDGEEQIALPDEPAPFPTVPGVHPILGAALIAAKAPRARRHLGGPAPSLSAADKLEVIRWLCRLVMPAASAREREQVEHLLGRIGTSVERAANEPPEGEEKRRFDELEQLAGDHPGESHIVTIARQAAAAAADIVGSRETELVHRARRAARLAAGIAGSAVLPRHDLAGYLDALDGELLRRELARAVEERAGGASAAVGHVLWRGVRDGEVRAWIARLEPAAGSERYGLLIEQEGAWTWTVGGRDDVCACVPEELFEEAATAVVRAGQREGADR